MNANYFSKIVHQVWWMLEFDSQCSTHHPSRFLKLQCAHDFQSRRLETKKQRAWTMRPGVLVSCGVRKPHTVAADNGFFKNNSPGRRPT